MPGIDERKEERFTLELTATISMHGVENDDASIELQTSDVSAGGAFFNTVQPLPIGTEVKIDMIIPLDKLKKLKGKRAKIEVAGAVIRSDEKGMAISFGKNYQISRVQI